MPRNRRQTPGTTVTKLSVVLILTGLMAGAVHLNAQAPKQPETSVLTGSPLGSVTFAHTAHAKTYGAKCENCHHASRTEKPLKTQQEKCTDCHTKVATPPMKTKTQAAFHDPMAKKGVCIDCHAQAAAKGKKVPTKCADCHKK